MFLEESLKVLVGGLLVAGAPGTDAGPRPTELQGSWMAVEAVRNGQPAREIVGHQLTIQGDRFTITGPTGKVLYQGTFTINPRATPAQVDFRHTAGQAEGKTWKGIYRLEGNTLRITDNGPDPTRDRPAELTAPKDSGLVSIVFQKARQ